MGEIAGLEVGLPADIDHVTAAWMTTVLRTSGAIGADDSVTSLTSEPFAVGVGLLSELHRCALTYDSACDGPATVIVKFPTVLPHQRAIADAFNIYEREVRAYTDVVPHSPIRTPQVHAALMAPDRTNCCLVMEDLSGLRQADPSAGATWQQAINAVDALAALHARWFESPDLEAMSETFISFQNPLHLAGLPGIHAAGWPAAKLHAAELFTPELIGFGDAWADHLPHMLDLVSTSPSVLHGDWRTDNMFFDDDDDVVVFDFQITAVGNGAYDLAYFLSQSLERETRAGRERELVQRYVDQLAAHGVERDVDRLMFDVRCATAFCIMYGFASYPEYEGLPETSKQMTHQLLRRSVEAIVDLDGVSAIEELVG
ncbi:MAG: phosphotransferase [Ilumatobacter sp.]